jgi:hypothetical protein
MLVALIADQCAWVSSNDASSKDATMSIDLDPPDRDYVTAS